MNLIFKCIWDTETEEIKHYIAFQPSIQPLPKNADEAGKMIATELAHFVINDPTTKPSSDNILVLFISTEKPVKDCIEIDQRDNSLRKEPKDYTLDWKSVFLIDNKDRNFPSNNTVNIVYDNFYELKKLLESDSLKAS